MRFCISYGQASLFRLGRGLRSCGLAGFKIRRGFIIRTRMMDRLDRMRHSFSHSLLIMLLLSCSLFVGCDVVKDEAGLAFREGGYGRWLLKQRPYLTNLHSSIVYYHGTSLEYDFGRSPNGRPPQPLIEYFVQAGDWDGLIHLQFHISVDAKNSPTGIREESAKFYKLPASETVVEGSYRMHRYYGLTVPQSGIEGVLRRAGRGDRFADLRSQANPSTFYQHEENEDGWEKLKSKTRIGLNAQGGANGRQPFSSQTNWTLAAPAPGRTP